MKIFALAVAGLALAGCQKLVSEMDYAEIKELAEELSKKCEQATGSRTAPEFHVCFDIEAKREIASREGRRARLRDAGSALADGLTETGNAYNRAAAQTPVYRPPVNCTTVSNPAGGLTTRCN